MGHPGEGGTYSPSPVKRGSIVTQAADEICRLIEGLSLKPGDSLPPETQLSEMLAISRNSVREALRVLHGLGVVEKSAGRGTIISALSTAGFAVVDEAALLEAAPVANEIRSLTMQKCAALAAERLNDASLEEITRVFRTLETAIGEGDQLGAKKAHEIFYGIVLKGARNPLLASMFMQADSARLTKLSPPSTHTFLSKRHLEQHRAVLAALTARDGKAAAKAVRSHFSNLGQMIDLVASRSSGSER
jgi:GntR family transcriptional regulator, transcriptional repressor for pyruvate dehydrogenase complex